MITNQQIMKSKKHSFHVNIEQNVLENHKRDYNFRKAGLFHNYACEKKGISSKSTSWDTKKNKNG